MRHRVQASDQIEFDQLLQILGEKKVEPVSRSPGEYFVVIETTVVILRELDKLDYAVTLESETDTEEDETEAAGNQDILSVEDAEKLDF